MNSTCFFLFTHQYNQTEKHQSNSTLVNLSFISTLVHNNSLKQGRKNNPQTCLSSSTIFLCSTSSCLLFFFRCPVDDSHLTPLPYSNSLSSSYLLHNDPSFFQLFFQDQRLNTSHRINSYVTNTTTTTSTSKDTAGSSYSSNSSGPSGYTQFPAFVSNDEREGKTPAASSLSTSLSTSSTSNTGSDNNSSK